jgi:hypothetical protein
MLETAIEIYRKDTGQFPSSADGLRALFQAPDSLTNWRGPYLATESMPFDAWGEPFVYHHPAQFGHTEYDLYSKGVNRQDDRGAQDDITSWSGVPRAFYSRPVRWSVWIPPVVLAIVGVLWGLRAWRRRTAA